MQLNAARFESPSIAGVTRRANSMSQDGNFQEITSSTRPYSERHDRDFPLHPKRDSALSFSSLPFPFLSARIFSPPTRESSV